MRSLGLHDSMLRLLLLLARKAHKHLLERCLADDVVEDTKLGPRTLHCCKECAEPRRATCGQLVRVGALESLQHSNIRHCVAP